MANWLGCGHTDGVSFLRPPSQFSVARGVHGFRSVLANFFFVQADDDEAAWFLIDAGLRGCGRRILREAAWRFGGRNGPRAILLTHGHVDHVGGLPALLERWDCPIYAHQRELVFLNERQPYPPPDPSVGGGLIPATSPLFPRVPPPLRVAVQALPADGSVPGLAEWRWIETPGHSPGHVSFWRERDRVLLAGDAVVTTRQESALAVWTQRREVRPPPAYFTPNWRLAFQSLERLRALRPDVLATGHGLPLSGLEMRAAWDALSADFESRGLPTHGRYVRQTWAQG